MKEIKKNWKITNVKFHENSENFNKCGEIQKVLKNFKKIEKFENRKILKNKKIMKNLM